MTKQETVSDIITLFNDQNRQKQYESIYADEKGTMIYSQLRARVLLLKVFRNRYLNEDAIQFTSDQKYRLFKELTESAISTVSNTTLSNIYTDFTSKFTQNRTKSTIPSEFTYGISKAEYTGTLISFPTAHELINLVDAINENDDEGRCSIPFSDAIAETPRQLQDGAFLLKVNLGVNREDLLKEFDIFLKNKQSSFHRRTAKSQISRSTLKETCYLELCDMMIFEAFYEHERKLDNKKLEDCDNFYGTNFSINNTIKKTVDMQSNKEIEESFRKTVKKNVNKWVEDESAFLSQISDLKLN